ncbi:MAG: ribonuclease H-like domain-containing protein [Halobacteriota archaeon]
MLIKGHGNQKLSRVGARIKSRVDQASDAADGEQVSSSQFIPALFYASGHSDYAQALALKRALIAKHDGKALEELIPGAELVTERGTCYRVQTEASVGIHTIPQKQVKENLLSDFKLLNGIRETTEHALKERGYRSIADLVEHDRFGAQALHFLRLLETRDTGELIEWVGRRFARSYPLALQTSGFHTPDQLLFVDVESLGLFASPIIMIGVAEAVDETLTVRQYVARNVGEEPAALAALLSHVDASTALVTFNGRAFDVPFLEQRLAYYRIHGNLRRTHFDMLQFARRRWRGLTPDFRLTSLEKHVIGARHSDIPSALVPEFYETYLLTQNAGPLAAIIDHNRQDLIALAHIFSKLCEG